MTRTNFLWRGVEYDSMENCLISVTMDSIMVSSAIVGSYRNRLYRAEYELDLDLQWNVISCSIRSQVDASLHKIEFKRMDGEWFLNGVHLPDLDDCADLDIPITPLTNTLPINRLTLGVGQQETICVVYIDLFTDKIKPVTQSYHRISQNI